MDYGPTRQSRPTGLYRAHPLLDPLGGLGLRGCTGPTPYWTRSAVSAYGAEQGPPLIGLTRQCPPTGLYRAHPLLDPLGSLGLWGCTGPTPYWTHSAVSAYGAVQGPPFIGMEWNDASETFWNLCSLCLIIVSANVVYNMWLAIGNFAKNIDNVGFFEQQLVRFSSFIACHRLHLRTVCTATVWYSSV